MTIARFTLLSSIILLLAVSCESVDKKQCSKFHKGQFISHGALGQRIIIERNDSVQVEINEQTGHVFKSKVKWISDCEYELTEFLEKSDSTSIFKSWLPGKTVITKILEANDDYCVYESKMSDVSMTLRDTLWVLE